jgi:hypothetical protein
MEPSEPQKTSIFESPEDTSFNDATVNNPQYSEEFRSHLSTLDDAGKAKAIADLNAPETDEELDALIGQGYKYQFKDPKRAKQYYEFKVKQKGNLVADIGNAIGMVPQIVGSALGSYKEDPVGATLKTVPSAIEGFVQNARDTVNIVSQSTDPSSPFFKMKQYFSGNMTDDQMMNQLNEAIYINSKSVALAEGRESIVFDERLLDKNLTVAFATFLEPEMLFPVLGPIALPSAIARAAGYGAQVEKAALRAQKITSGVLGGTIKWGVGKPAQFIGNLASGVIETTAAKTIGVLENFTGIDANDIARTGRTAGLATASAHVAGYSIPFAGPIAATHLGGGLLAGFGQAVTETSDQMLRTQGHRGVLGFARQALKDASDNGVRLTKQGEMFMKLIDTFDPALSYAYHVGEGAITGGAVGGLISYGSQGSDGIGQGIGYGVGAGAIGGAAGRLIASGTGSIRKLKREVQAEFAQRAIAQYSPETAYGLDALRNHPAANAETRQAMNDLAVTVSELDHNAQIKVFGGGQNSSTAEFAAWRLSNKGVMEITNSQFSNIEAFTVIRKQDGQLIIGVNSDVLFSPTNKYGDHTLPHELLHAVTMSSAIGPHFVSIGKDLIFGVRDANGKILQKPLVDVKEISEFMSQYREAETGWYKNVPAGPEREAARLEYIKDRALQSSALAKLNGDGNVGSNTTLTIQEEAAIGKYANEFLSYYFSAQFKEIPMEFFLKGGKLDGLQNVLQIAKDSLRDHWETRISFHEPRFNFFRNRGKSIDAGFYRDGKRVRIGALDYFIRDMLRANIEFKNSGVMDFSKMSEFTKNRLLESGAGSVLIRDPKTGKVRSKTKKEVNSDNKQRGSSGFRVLEAMDKSLRKSFTGADGVIRGDYSDAEFDALAQNGVITPAEAHMGKLFQRTKESNGTLPNVFEFGVLAASKQIEGLGDNDRVTGNRVPLTNRKVLLADVVMEYGIDGHFTMRIKTLDMRVIERRMSTVWQNPAAKELWGESREFFESDFKKYLSNASLPHNHPARVETAMLFENGDGRGDARRDYMYEVAGFAKGEDVAFKNTPVAQVARGTLMSVTDFSIPTLLNVRTSGQSYNYIHANAFYDIATNFKPAAFKPVSGINNLYENPIGYRIVKKENKLYIYGANGQLLGSEDTYQKAAALAEKHFEIAIPEQMKKDNAEHSAEVAKFKVKVSKEELQDVLIGNKTLKDLDAVRALRENDSVDFVEEFHSEVLARNYETMMSRTPNAIKTFEELLEQATKTLDDEGGPYLVKEGEEYYLVPKKTETTDSKKSRLIYSLNKSDDSKHESIKIILSEKASFTETVGKRVAESSKAMRAARSIYSMINLNYARSLVGENGKGSVALLLHTSASTDISKNRAFSKNKETRSGGTSFATGEGHISSISKKLGTPTYFLDKEGRYIGQYAVSATRLKNPKIVNIAEEVNKVVEILKQKLKLGKNEYWDYVKGIYPEGTTPIIPTVKDGGISLSKDERLVLTDRYLLEQNPNRDIIKISKLPFARNKNLKDPSWNYGSAVTILMKTSDAAERTAVLGFNYSEGSVGRERVSDAKNILDSRKTIKNSITSPLTAEILSSIIPSSVGSDKKEGPFVRPSRMAILKPKNASEYFHEEYVLPLLTSNSKMSEFSEKLQDQFSQHVGEHLLELTGTPSFQRLEAFQKYIDERINALDSDPQYVPIPEEEFTRNSILVAMQRIADATPKRRDGNIAATKRKTAIRTREFSDGIRDDAEGKMNGFLEDRTMEEYGTSIELQNVIDEEFNSILWKLEEHWDYYQSALRALENLEKNLKDLQNGLGTSNVAEMGDSAIQYRTLVDEEKSQRLHFEWHKLNWEITVKRFREHADTIFSNSEELKALIEKQSGGLFTVEMRERSYYKYARPYGGKEGGRNNNEGVLGEYINVPEEFMVKEHEGTVGFFNLQNQPTDVQLMVKDVLTKKRTMATVVPSLSFKTVLEAIKVKSGQPIVSGPDKQPSRTWSLKKEPKTSALYLDLVTEGSDVRVLLEKIQTDNEAVKDSVREDRKIWSTIEDASDKAWRNASERQTYEQYTSSLAFKKIQDAGDIQTKEWKKHGEDSLEGMSAGEAYLAVVELFRHGKNDAVKDYLRVAKQFEEINRNHSLFMFRARDASSRNAVEEKMMAVQEFDSYISSVRTSGNAKVFSALEFYERARKSAIEAFSDAKTAGMFQSRLRDSFVLMYEKSPNGIKPKVILQNLQLLSSTGTPAVPEATQIGLIKFIKDIDAARYGKPNEKIQLSEILEYIDRNSFKVEVKDKIGILDDASHGYIQYTLGGNQMADLDYYGTIGAWVSASSPEKYFPHGISKRGHMRPQRNAIVHLRYSERTLMTNDRVFLTEEIQANNSQLEQVEALNVMKLKEAYDREIDGISGQFLDALFAKLTTTSTDAIRPESLLHIASRLHSFGEMEFELHFDSTAAETAFYKLSGSKGTKDKFAESIVKGLVETKLRQSQSEVQANQSVQDLMTELKVAALTAQADKSFLPDIIKTHARNGAFERAINSHLQDSKRHIGVSLTESKAKTLFETYEPEDLNAIYRSIWGGIVTPELVRSVDLYVQEAMYRNLASYTKRADKYVEFAAYVDVIASKTSLNDGLETIIQDAVARSTFKEGIIHPTNQEANITAKEIGLLVSRMLTAGNKYHYASQNRAKGINNLLKSTADTMVKKVCQMRDLRVQEEFIKGILAGKIDPESDSVDIKLWGSTFEVKNSEHYDRGNTGQVWGHKSPLWRAQEVNSIMKRILGAYIKKDLTNLSRHLGNSFSVLRGDTSTGDAFDEARGFFVDNGDGTLSVDPDKDLRFDEDTTLSSLATRIYTGLRERGLAGSPSSIAKLGHDAMMKLSRNEPVLHIAESLLNSYYGDNFKRIGAVIDVYDSKFAQKDTEEFSRIELAAEYLSMVEGIKGDKDLVELLRTKDSDVQSRIYGEMKATAASSHGGGVRESKKDAGAVSIIKDILYKRVYGNAIGESKMKRVNELIDLAFQPSNEHRLIAIRMAIKRAKLGGAKRVFFANPELSGSVSGLPIDKARALYTMDPKIAAKEAKRLGFKFNKAQEVMTYLPDALAKLDPDTALIIQTTTKNAEAAKAARIAAVKSLIPEFKLRENGEVYATGIDPAVEAILAKGSRAAGYSQYDEFLAYPSRNDRHSITINEDNGHYRFGMYGSQPNYSLDKVLYKYLRDYNNDVGSACEALGRHLLKGVGRSGAADSLHGRGLNDLMRVIHAYMGSEGINFSNGEKADFGKFTEIWVKNPVETQHLLSDASKKFLVFDTTARYRESVRYIEEMIEPSLDDAGRKITAVAKAWALDAANYAENLTELISVNNFGKIGTGGPRPIDLAVSTMANVEIPDTAATLPKVSDEFENGMPFYKPSVKSASPNDRPFKNDFFSDASKSSPVINKVKLYAISSENAERYTFTVSLRKLDGSAIDENNKNTEYMAVINKQNYEASILPISTDADSEYMKLARAETIARLAAFGVVKYDDAEFQNPTNEKDIGEPVVVNAPKPSANDRAEEVLNKPKIGKSEPPQMTWNQRTAGYGTTLTTMDGYYIMAMNNKFRLYNAQQAIIGVYATEEEARKKSEAYRNKGRKQ